MMASPCESGPVQKSLGSPCAAYFARPLLAAGRLLAAANKSLAQGNKTPEGFVIQAMARRVKLPNESGFHASPPHWKFKMSESERLSGARIARLTELLAQLHQISWLMGDHYASYANPVWIATRQQPP